MDKQPAGREITKTRSVIHPGAGKEVNIPHRKSYHGRASPRDNSGGCSDGPAKMFIGGTRGTVLKVDLLFIATCDGDPRF